MSECLRIGGRKRNVNYTDFQCLYVRVQLDALQVQAGIAEEDLEIVDVPAPGL